MGRIYDINDVPTLNVRVYAPTGCMMTGVYRVEFDDDADEGMATVHTLVRDDSGAFFRGEANEVAKATFRMYARILPKPAPNRIDPLRRGAVDSRGVSHAQLPNDITDKARYITAFRAMGMTAEAAEVEYQKQLDVLPHVVG